MRQYSRVGVVTLHAPSDTSSIHGIHSEYICAICWWMQVQPNILSILTEWYSINIHQYPMQLSKSQPTMLPLLSLGLHGPEAWLMMARPVPSWWELWSQIQWHPWAWVHQGARWYVACAAHSWRAEWSICWAAGTRNHIQRPTHQGLLTCTAGFALVILWCLQEGGGGQNSETPKIWSAGGVLPQPIEMPLFVQAGSCSTHRCLAYHAMLL